MEWLAGVLVLVAVQLVFFIALAVLGMLRRKTILRDYLIFGVGGVAALVGTQINTALGI